MRCLAQVSVWLGCFLGWVTVTWGQTPEDVVMDFSTRMLDILKGPIAKILAATILLVGVAALLRGKHRLAISCGAAFVVLLFFPILLEQISGGGQ